MNGLIPSDLPPRHDTPTLCSGDWLVFFSSYWLNAIIHVLYCRLISNYSHFLGTFSALLGCCLCVYIIHVLFLSFVPTVFICFIRLVLSFRFDLVLMIRAFRYFCYCMDALEYPRVLFLDLNTFACCWRVQVRYFVIVSFVMMCDYIIPQRSMFYSLRFT